MWGRWVQPKHSILSWQVCVDALKTQDRLRNMGILEHSKYSLCKFKEENSCHLFFNYQYSQKVWSRIKQEIGLPPIVKSSKREWNFILRLCKGKQEAKEIYKVVLCTTLYYIWRERNKRKFNNCSIIASALAKDIITKVKKHLRITLSVLTDSMQSKLICGFLNISPEWKKREQILCR